MNHFGSQFQRFYTILSWLNCLWVCVKAEHHVGVVCGEANLLIHGSQEAKTDQHYNIAFSDTAPNPKGFATS
jgi:hypothetical protein